MNVVCFCIRSMCCVRRPTKEPGPRKVYGEHSPHTQSEIDRNFGPKKTAHLSIYRQTNITKHRRTNRARERERARRRQRAYPTLRQTKNRFSMATSNSMQIVWVKQLIRTIIRFLYPAPTPSSFRNSVIQLGANSNEVSDEPVIEAVMVAIKRRPDDSALTLARASAPTWSAHQICKRFTVRLIRLFH